MLRPTCSRFEEEDLALSLCLMWTISQEQFWVRFVFLYWFLVVYMNHMRANPSMSCFFIYFSSSDHDISGLVAATLTETLCCPSLSKYFWTPTVPPWNKIRNEYEILVVVLKERSQRVTQNYSNSPSEDDEYSRIFYAEDQSVGGDLIQNTAAVSPRVQQEYRAECALDWS